MPEVAVDGQDREPVLNGQRRDDQVAHRQDPALGAEFGRKLSGPAPRLFPRLHVVETGERLLKLIPVIGVPDSGQEFGKHYPACHRLG